MRLIWILWTAAAVSCSEDLARGQNTAGLGSAARSNVFGPLIIEPFSALEPPEFRLAANVQGPVQSPAVVEPPTNHWLTPGNAVSVFDPPASPCDCGASCDMGNCWKPHCDGCPKYGIYGLLGYDSWRGVQDDSWQNNGLHVGLNFGTRLGRFSELTGIGFQAGATMGVYNFDGTDCRPTDNNASQQQAFVTYGFFRRATESCRFSGAIVQDWMLNDNYGVYSQNPTLSQFRAQLGYALNAWNEIGFWGTWRCLDSTRDVSGEGSTIWRAVDQASFFWHHKWKARGPDTSVWVGMPEKNRLSGGGSLGDYIVGISAQLPLSDWVAVYNVLSYMHASSHPSPSGSEENAWNFTMGLAFYPTRSARSNTVAGQCWMPLMPVANNGYFLVDTNNH
jgi:hypothetical protein